MVRLLRHVTEEAATIKNIASSCVFRQARLSSKGLGVESERSEAVKDG